MTYTTQGLMNPADLADTRKLYDLDCEPNEVSDYDDQVKMPDAPVTTYERLAGYVKRSASGKLTDRQRRRLVKKAGRNGDAEIVRDDGMGYPPGMQGYKEIAVGLPVPVSGAPMGDWLNEPTR